MAFHEKTFRGSSQDAVVGKRILFSHDIVSNLTAWKIKRTGLEEKKRREGIEMARVKGNGKQAS